MCLQAQNMHRKRIHGRNYKWSPKVAKNDIKVWKVLSAYDNDHYFTPYFRMAVKFIDGVCSFSTRDKEADVSESGEVAGGFFHSFTDFKRADTWKWFFALSGIDSTRKVCICEAVIPKGSLVYYGKDGDIASNNIIIYEPKKFLDKE